MSDTLNTDILSHYWSSDLEELLLWGSQGKVHISLQTEAESASETSCLFNETMEKVQKSRSCQRAIHHCQSPIVLYGSLHFISQIFFVTSYRLDLSRQLSQLIRLATLAAKSNKKDICQNEKGNSVGLQYNSPNNLILFRAGSIWPKHSYIIIWVELTCLHKSCSLYRDRVREIQYKRFHRNARWYLRHNM